MSSPNQVAVLEREEKAVTTLGHRVNASEDDNKTAVDDLEKAKDSEDTIDTSDPPGVLTGKRLLLAFIGMMLCVLMSAADATIIAPALPVISSQFGASAELGWISGAYFLTEAAFVLAIGQALKLFDRRMMYLLAIGCFEIGSILCGAAHNLVTLVVGRAVAGIGGAGIAVSTISVIAEITRLQDRPKLFGCFGAVYGVASVVGPIVGGLFTQHVTWRLCFLINLPLGLFAILAIVFLIPRSPHISLDAEMTALATQRYHRLRLPVPARLGLLKMACLDLLGSIFFLGFVITLVMALQWGGTAYKWSDATIIALLAVSGTMLVAFVLWEYYNQGSSPMLNLAFFKNRSIVGACVIAFSCSFILIAGATFLPLYWQATRGRSPASSGIDLLPFVIGITGCSIVSGQIVSRTGNYFLWLLLAPLLTGLGSGLLFASRVDTPAPQVKAFSFLFAAGIGFVFQQSPIVVQANVDRASIPTATALTTLTQLFGGLIGSTACNTIFQNLLTQTLAKYAPTANAEVLKERIAAIYEDDITPPAIREAVVQAYTKALTNMFVVGVPLSVCIILAGLGVRWVNIKRPR